jgi:hypothetical protein
MPIAPDHREYETPVKISLDRITWSPCGPDDDPKAKLIATLTIGGVHHHLEAYQVEMLETELAVSPGRARELGYVPTTTEQVPVEAIADLFPDEAFPGDGPFETVEIEGRTYCLFMSPYRT